MTLPIESGIPRAPDQAEGWIEKQLEPNQICTHRRGGPCKNTTFYRYLPTPQSGHPPSKSNREPDGRFDRKAYANAYIRHGPKTAKGRWYLQRLPRASDTRTASMPHLCRADTDRKALPPENV